MAAFKVYGSAESLAVGRVLITIFEKEITDWELVPVNVTAGEHKKPEFLALQPFGEIPVVIFGSQPFFESRAIIRSLENKFPSQGTPLYGFTPLHKAFVEQWIEVEGQNYGPAVVSVFKVLRSGQKDEAVLNANIAKVEAVLDVYEAQLSKSKYLAGDFFSLADLTNIPPTDKLISRAKLGNLIESRPHVKAWWGDVTSRPSWKKVVALASA